MEKRIGEKMQEKIKNVHDRSYKSPQCTLVPLGKEDVVATSNIFLPMHPLADDPDEYYNNPGLID